VFSHLNVHAEEAAKRDKGEETEIERILRILTFGSTHSLGIEVWSI